MTAHNPLPFTAVAVENAALLRCLRDKGWRNKAHLAELIGRDPSNLNRTLRLLESESLIEGMALTPAAVTALEALDRISEGESGAASAPALWPIDGFAFNPLNPRKSIDQTEIEALAETIALEGLLHPLLAYPAAANGVRILHAGERRLRALCLLREQGRLPPAYKDGVPFIEHPADDALALKIGLIENSQREGLTPWEDAQALRKLADLTGATAAEVARMVGRASETSTKGVRDVQQKIKVAREAGEDAIRAHLADPKRYTWEILRDSVRAHGDAQARIDQAEVLDADAVQPGALEMDAFDEDQFVIEPSDGADGGPVYFSEAVRTAAVAAAQAAEGNDWIRNAKLNGTTTVEGETWPIKTCEWIKTTWKGYPSVEIRLTESSRHRWHYSLRTQQGGPGFSGTSSPPYVYTNDPIFASRAAALAHAAERAAARLGDWASKRNYQDWINGLLNRALAKPIDLAAGEAQIARHAPRDDAPRSGGAGSPKPDPNRGAPPENAGEVTFALKIGDFVSTGSEATSYQLLASRNGNGIGRPAWRTQPWRNGKPYGDQATVTLAAIVAVVPAPKGA